MSEFAQTTLCSSLACIISYPIDTTKTRLQVEGGRLFDIIKKSGSIKGLYSGLQYNLMTYPVFWGVFFQTNHYLNSQNKIPMLNSFASSILASLISNPLFVLKIRSQTNNEINTIGKIIKTEGMHGMFKGLKPTIFNNTKLAVQIPMYDWLKEHDYNIIFASTFSKITTSGLFYPLDIVRTQERNSIKKENLLKLFRDIVKRDGYRGLYKGVGMYTLTTLPNFVIMMWLREQFKKS
jgi:solute carrier family 25 (mitochondrial folate transporter), member 32